MKEQTIIAIRNNLKKEKDTHERFERYNDYVFEYEYVPVLTQRRKRDGRLMQIMNVDNRMVFENENREIDEENY